ncbi:MAG: thiol peroxidase [Anaerolineae bacterium CG_4_9_14_3_um_filter_57_17]|nr:thiol peroxidase [bacterium]NCT20632.1 thiol peroxidase [bacterium]OIO85676.1 MAG: lipid hydroperoxide peroxidase [Anaerolineae bacterium CG2_30_57_67]PJB64591.1 MAG: thiol peroxidase [Anaerolineae bacterium CG_4_9_14_3_um_filter_57_17]
MTTERFGMIKFAGKEQTVIGDDIQVGQKAPEFTIQKNDWSLAKGLKETRGKVRILAAVPSLDTPVCDRETRRFNEAAAQLGKDVAILTLSMDLPVAQKRWCGAAGVTQVQTFSDVVKADFGKKYGVLMKEVRLLRRAVFVVDKKGMVVYAAYMPVNGDEPAYEEVLAAAKKALGK